MASHRVDPERVYVAGSVGGRRDGGDHDRAPIPICTRRRAFTRASPIGCAHDLPSALAAMRGGKGKARRRSRGGDGTDTPKRPLIVFHGDADTTVHPSNATELVRGFDVEASTPNHAPSRMQRARRACTVKRLKSASGVDAESWTIHGAPHAWAGGSSRGTYTDPAGPDASAEMMRFFLAHPRRH